ncbi:hypothetical protein Ancab_009752 [Ancistrocladus abbreviatus]
MICGVAKWLSASSFTKRKSPCAAVYLDRMDERVENGGVKKIMSPCDVEALKKCLEENKGDYVKCQSQIEAFKLSCSLKKQNSSLGVSTNIKVD